jgi:hypothetical protein
MVPFIILSLGFLAMNSGKTSIICFDSSFFTLFVVSSIFENYSVIAEEKQDKKRKSIDQLNRAAQEMPELFRDHMKLLLESQETMQELARVRVQYHAATETMRVQMSTGTTTIIRSLFQVAISKIKDEAWRAVSDLYTHIYNEQAPYDVLACLPTDADLITHVVTFTNGSTHTIDEGYYRNCSAVVFLREISNLPSKEKSVRWRARYAAEVPVLTTLEGVNYQPEEEVRRALESIFGVLSDEVHQAAARFETDGNFYLPRAGSAFSFAQILAMASIVASNGLVPKYPTAEEDRLYS